MVAVLLKVIIHGILVGVIVNVVRYVKLVNTEILVKYSNLFM